MKTFNYSLAALAAGIMLWALVFGPPTLFWWGAGLAATSLIFFAILPEPDPTAPRLETKPAPANGGSKSAKISPDRRPAVVGTRQVVAYSSPPPLKRPPIEPKTHNVHSVTNDTDGRTDSSGGGE